MSDAQAPTLDQRRARHAWEAVKRVASSSNPSIGEDYAREVKRLPVRIVGAGLGHAAAFLLAKRNMQGGDANEALLCDLADWVLDKRDNPESRTKRPEASALVEEITKRDGTFLQIATDEAFAYLRWLTRFAEAELKASED